MHRSPNLQLGNTLQGAFGCKYSHLSPNLHAGQYLHFSFGTAIFGKVSGIFRMGLIDADSCFLLNIIGDGGRLDFGESPKFVIDVGDIDPSF